MWLNQLDRRLSFRGSWVRIRQRSFRQCSPKGGVLDRTHEASSLKARQIPTYSMRVLHHPLSCVTARTKCSVHSPECGKSRVHSIFFSWHNVACISDTCLEFPTYLETICVPLNPAHLKFKGDLKMKVGERLNGFPRLSLNARNVFFLAPFCSRTVLTW